MLSFFVFVFVFVFFQLEWGFFSVCKQLVLSTRIPRGKFDKNIPCLVLNNIVLYLCQEFTITVTPWYILYTCTYASCFCFHITSNCHANYVYIRLIFSKRRKTVTPIRPNFPLQTGNKTNAENITPNIFALILFICVYRCPPRLLYQMILVNTMGSTIGAGIAYPSTAYEFTRIFMVYC